MTAKEKLELDLRDFWRIHDGLEVYSGLDEKAMIERLKVHSEDGLCNVSDYSGAGTLLCTRDGYLAIFELAERHREMLPVPDDYSVKELAEGIRKHIARAIVDEKQDEPALARVLAEAVADAATDHVERTYHFPCVLITPREPPQFQIGPVLFTTAKSFREAFGTEIRQYIEQSHDQEYASTRVDEFEKFVTTFGWVGTVTVPPCAEDCAQRRAELSVSTSINLLRLVFGVQHARDMRLAHLTPSRPLHSEHAISQDGKLRFVWSRKTPGAFIGGDWHLQLGKWDDFLRDAARIISTTIAGSRSEVADRIIDALTWFGDAAFESAPGIQIVNFVAALERLTTTEWFKTHLFCSRIAFLAHNDEADFEKRYWDAYTIHNARSAVIHGGRSPGHPIFQRWVRLSHEVTRNALFRGLEVHGVLENNLNGASDLAHLRNFFTSQQSRRAALLKELRAKLGVKEEIKRRKIALDPLDPSIFDN